MQTLKTAAIVVLLMTIIYAAYVSLTTPPEQLPPEVEGMLVMTEDGEFSIDEGLPESLGAVAFEEGTPEAVFDAATASLQAPSVSEPPGSLGLPVQGTPGVGVTGSLDDHSISLSDGAAATPNLASAASTNPALQSGYQSTGQSFSMPDPRALDNVNFQTASSVTPSLGPAAMEPPDVPEIQTAPDIAAAAPSIEPNIGVTNAIRAADKLYGEDRLADALSTLSLFYNTPNLSGEQRGDMLSRLDPLAREVIYSRRHLLEQPYRVGQNETLVEIAAKYEVPWQLLANINQVSNPVTVLPGTELKVVRGPFRAEVDLVQKELTLFLGDLYAGRFPVAIGNDPAPRVGTYTIQDKQVSRTYYDASGAPIPHGSPDNPYGNVWMDLGGQLSIHGSPNTTRPTDKGCVSLAGDHADDLYGILSQGSSVTIRR
ncbi:MAG: LysM peptidoglycan-binding domain-containing protein [Pirellulales bacterium]|nr:LysM peptidoglycan-binding domain-containing protein [Pirellulales bacterium]